MNYLVLAGFFLFALESIVEFVKKVLPEAWQIHIPWRLASALIAFVLAWLLGVRFFSWIGENIGFTLNPWIDYALSAIFASGGSGLVHDLLAWAQANKDKVREI